MVPNISGVLTLVRHALLTAAGGATITHSDLERMGVLIGSCAIVAREMEAKINGLGADLDAGAKIIAFPSHRTRKSRTPSGPGAA